MTLKSALQDVKDTTLAAVAGMLGKLAYLASLRQKQGRYEHWGMETVYGAEASERALKTAHSEILKNVLRTPLPELERDLAVSSAGPGVNPEAYVEEMRAQLLELLPDGRQDSPASEHLNSVLLALSRLEKSREHATRLTS